VPDDDRCELLCLNVEQAEEIRRLAAALARANELCVCDLAWIAERSQNLVSHHLRALRAGGLVDSRREGKMVLYALTPAGRALLETVFAVEEEAAR
jgi:DNA-binding transcriptional ArsR family regulator